MFSVHALRLCKIVYVLKYYRGIQVIYEDHYKLHNLGQQKCMHGYSQTLLKRFLSVYIVGCRVYT